MSANEPLPRTLKKPVPPPAAPSSATSSGAPAANGAILETAKLLLNDYQDQIKIADSKSPLIIAVNSLLAGGTAAFLAYGDKWGAFFSRRPAAHQPGALDQCVAVLSVLLFIFTVLFILLSVFCAVAAVMPDLTPPEHRGLFYFGGLAAIPEKEYIAQFRRQSEEEICVSLLSQVYAKGRIASRKYVDIQKSVKALRIAIILWALMLFCLAYILRR